MEALAQRALHQAFRHEAFFYASQDEFLTGAVSFIRDGLADDESILVVLSPEKIEALREELGVGAERVHFADTEEVGANPGRIIPALRDFVSAHGAVGKGVRGLGEPIGPDRAGAELVECQRQESLLNLAFADSPSLYLMCAYDIAGLNPRVLVHARRSHPHLVVNGQEHHNSDYCGLEEIAAPFSEPLPAPAVQPDWKVFGVRALGELREFVSERAARFGLDQERTADLALAMNEIASNSVAHGGGGGTVRVWQEDDALICEVNDKGRIDEPMIGRERPALTQHDGHGMELANQLCDLVQVRAFPHGSAVRLHMRR